jgi:DNA-binding response OmpR family regulator
MLQTSADDVKPSRAKILIVEDDDGLAEEIMHELQSLGFEMTRECSAPAALKRIESASFNLLILDRMLGASDGLSSSSLCVHRTTMFRFLWSAR